jgi:hypothetical protein
MNWIMNITFRDGTQETHTIYDWRVFGSILCISVTPWDAKISRTKNFPTDLIKEYTTEYVSEVK